MAPCTDVKPASCKPPAWLAAALVLGLLHAAGAHLLTIPVGGPLPKIPQVTFTSIGDTLELSLFNNTLTVNDPRNPGGYAARWNSPLWTGTVNGKEYPIALQAPTIILGTPTFRIKLTNGLPFQAACTCGCNPAGDNPDYCLDCVTATTVPDINNPLQLYNGVHNLMYNNMHTHGLKVDVGANDIRNLDVCSGLLDDRICTGTPGSTTTTADVSCPVFSDNVFVTVAPGGMSATNTYIVPEGVPGIFWHHDHEHGSVAYQTSTTHGAILIPDLNPRQLFAPRDSSVFHDLMGISDWSEWGSNAPTSQFLEYKDGVWGSEDDQKKWDKYNQKVWKQARANQGSINVCNRFIEVIQSLPNFSPEVETIVFSGLWLRTNQNGPPGQETQYDDDTLPFISCNALPPGPLLSPRGLRPAAADPTATVCDVENIDNPAERDWVAVNSVIQPTIRLTAGRYQRWQMLNTMTMKFLDLTIRRLPERVAPGETASAGPVVEDCKIWLLAHDGVYLPLVPRLVKTTVAGGNAPAASNIVLGPANRADMLIKCSTPGTYGLFSGAGPFNTDADCTATHCELFGGRVGLPGLTHNTTGNNFYAGQELSSALIAVVEVEACDSGKGNGKSDGKGKVNGNGNDKKCEEQPDLEDGMCRTRLELFEYTDTRRTLQLPTQQAQCVNLVNLQGGGFCNVNGVLFGNNSTGNAVACITQGSGQTWQYRGQSYHPFHLHETPVQIQVKPNCITNSGVDTNFWEAKDFFDTMYIPQCQCNTTADTTCDEVLTTFRGTAFPPVPAGFETTNRGQLTRITREYLRLYGALQMANTLLPASRRALMTNTGPLPCEDRYSVLHCHVLAHEDEGCMKLVWWKCPNTPAPGGGVTGVCSLDATCPAQGDPVLGLLRAAAGVIPQDELAKASRHGHGG